MNERDRLIELIEQHCLARLDALECTSEKEIEYSERLADYLLANGVIVPPCKVGDTVYWVTSDSKIYQTSFSLPTSWSAFGISLFLTREEAEQVLNEGRAPDPRPEWQLRMLRTFGGDSNV